MIGQFTFFVATKVPKTELSLCSVCVFGTRYLRAIDPPSSITLDKSPYTLSVDHIYEDISSGVTLAINLR